MENKENKIREELSLKLNEFESDKILSCFNEFSNGSLDDQINSVIGYWTNEEFKEFIDFLESRK